MLLARRVDSEGGWVRVGLASIVLYEPEKILFGNEHKNTSYDEKKDKLGLITREEIEIALEENADQHREMFRRFDDVEAREYVIW
jgi:hypothetical protein